MRGHDFYDDPVIFNAYVARRRSPQNPNDAIEQPIFWEMVGEPSGLEILDLGCGTAGFGRDLLERGAKRYVGVEGSNNMAEAALKALAGTGGEVVVSSIEAWEYPGEAFDLVVSRLALHYIEDIEACFRQLYSTLVPGGRLVFSVEHPILTSCNRSAESSARRGDWIVDDYFCTGQRTYSWLGGTVMKFHRTVEDYFHALQAAGFTVQSLRESRPAPGLLDQQEYERRLRIPLFLFLSAEKERRA